ncbi:MAG: hypothetical protein L0Z55_07780 [Planctomycetes bacterium]|nr:hypothetical protein [Planctomycetota bacterium]
MARVDKTSTNAYYEIDLDTKSNLPTSIKFVVLTGVKSTKDENGKKSESEEHVAFKFNYNLGLWDSVEKFSVPPAAKKVLKL